MKRLLCITFVMAIIIPILSMEPEPYNHYGFTNEEIRDWENISQYIARNHCYVHAQDDWGNTALYYIVSAPSNENDTYSSSNVELLIKNKADVNFINLEADHPTPLHTAIHGLHYKNALILLKNKAKILQNNRKQSPLHMLFCTPPEPGKYTLIKALVKQDPTCINLQDKEGSTALHLAAGYAGTTTLDLGALLLLGSDITLRDNKGDTAVDIITRVNPSMVYLFKLAQCYTNTTHYLNSSVPIWLAILVAAIFSYYNAETNKSI